MPQIGLSELSDIKERIVKNSDGKTAIRYRVVEEVIDLEALKKEKERLEAELAIPEPTAEELIEEGKMIHPYYRRDEVMIKQRIEEINKILGG